MKKIHYVPVFFLFIAMGCSNKGQDNVSPSSDQKVLGLVIDNTGSTILLKDGRAISPMVTPNNFKIAVGNKYLFSFTPLSTSPDKKLSYVKITSYSSAQDSTFSPPATGSDSTAIWATLQGSTFTGIFTYATVDYSHAADTTKMTGSTSITFDNQHNYVSTASPNGYPAGGSGSFTFTSSNNILHFVNSASFPAGTNQNFILNGEYFYRIFDSNLAIWKYTNQTYFGYLLKK